MKVIKVCVIGGGNDKKRWLNRILNATNDIHPICSIGCEVYPFTLPTHDFTLNLWLINDVNDGYAKGYILDVDYYILFDTKHLDFVGNTPYIVYSWNEATSEQPLWSIHSHVMHTIAYH
jgi:hypothetical protein